MYTTVNALAEPILSTRKQHCEKASLSHASGTFDRMLGYPPLVPRLAAEECGSVGTELI